VKVPVRQKKYIFLIVRAWSF